MVKQVRGVVRITSQSGKGTSFLLQLPVTLWVGQFPSHGFTVSVDCDEGCNATAKRNGFRRRFSARMAGWVSR